MEASLKAFSLMLLHPRFLKKMEKSKFLDVIDVINSVYGDFLSNFQNEVRTWYDVSSTSTNDSPLINLEYIDLISEAEQFYPILGAAFKIAYQLLSVSSNVHLLLCDE